MGGVGDKFKVSVEVLFTILPFDSSNVLSKQLGNMSVICENCQCQFISCGCKMRYVHYCMSQTDMGTVYPRLGLKMFE